MKNKLSPYVKSLILGAVTASFILTGFSAKADQVFLFSDDLSALFDIDQGQTSAKLNFGRFYTADDSVSSAVVSKVVASPSKTIISARLDADQSWPSDTRIIYYLSNNNGFRWTQVNLGYTYNFDSAGNELRWRAVIARGSPFIASAYVDNVNITYTVSDSLAPAPSINYSSNYSGGNNDPLGAIYGSGGDLASFVCGALSSVGLGCGAPQKVETPVYGQQIPILSPAEQQNRGSSISDQNFSNSRKIGTDTTAPLQASIANIAVKRSFSDDEVILVKVPVGGNIKATLGLNTAEAIYEIIKGQKHFISTMDIFFDYGFSLDAVQNATQKDLEPFPRVKLVRIYKDKKTTYYITEGNMIRFIPNKKVFESYGDRNEDVITISKKEFNFYPRNQYVFLENPLSADVFQIVNDGTKRFIVPQVMRRLRIKQDQIAPINQTQLNTYNNGSPVVF